MSSDAAQSRTDRVIMCSVARPPQPSPFSGPSGIRPREGFRPSTPQQDAGMRIDPPPSLPWAMRTMPLASAAPAPPLDPPALWPVFQGFCVAGP